MPNINIELPDELHKKLKIVCALSSITLKDFINKAIDEEVRKKVENG